MSVAGASVRGEWRNEEAVCGGARGRGNLTERLLVPPLPGLQHVLNIIDVASMRVVELGA
ncbi:hypothetical protein CP978_28820 [Streptomyces nodosus]|uniref:Uncharacterized protein n=1 Tax=Streptomyces nodosus TaxID=40318 RepID=A0A0B5DQF1_9ACTN|nr:hypothetical protein SNOD_28550 [Streptomyces nodosus]QEV42034.1 hypothetical protein CP978_28820 [Streptomyces nodosus]